MDRVPTEIVFSISSNTTDSASSPNGLYSYLRGPVKVPGPWKRGRPKVEKPKSAPFQFINVPGENKYVDSASLSKIRSHARKTKARQNASLHGLPHLVTKQKELKAGGNPDEWKVGQVFQNNLSQIPGVDPFNTSCIALEPYMHDLLSLFLSRIWRSIYSLEEVGGWNPIEQYWLPLAFQDPALLHSLIACADAYVNGYTAGQVGPRWLRHLRETIRIINQRIAVPVHPVSKQTVAVIAGMALLEKGSGRHEHWRTHMKGLKVLIELAGGFEALHSEPLIIHKIYRADLYGSLDAGELPFFHGPNDLGSHQHPRDTLQSERFAEIFELINFEKTLFSCISQLEEVEGFWAGRKSVSEIADSSGATTNMMGYSPREIARIRHILTSIQYKLVLAVNSQQRVALGPTKGAIFELLRITLIIYTLTLLKERPQSTYVGQIIANTFYQSLATASEEAQATINPRTHRGKTTDIYGISDPTLNSPLLSFVPADFLLWAVFLAVVVLPTANLFQEGNAIKTTLLNVFSSLVHAPFLHSQDIKLRISQYLWVPSIHDALFDRFWLDFELEAQRIQHISTLS